jgi:hypothetical protein
VLTESALEDEGRASYIRARRLAQAACLASVVVTRRPTGPGCRSHLPIPDGAALGRLFLLQGNWIPKRSRRPGAFISPLAIHLRA